MQRVCSWLCEQIRKGGIAVRPGVVHKAALLAKADLTTELVKEFTELQGIVGGLYARVQELDPDMKADAREAVATAIYDHYKPESMEDSVPRTVEGAVLSDRGQGRQHCRHVRAWTAADRIERSVRFAPSGKWNRQDDC